MLGAAVVAAGLSQAQAEELLRASTTPEVKDALRDATNEAVSKYGAFGAPTMVVDHPALKGKQEMFFGSDRLDHLAFAIGKIHRGWLMWLC